MALTGYGLAPGAHPAGGNPDNLVPVPLEDEMVRLAVTTGAQIEFIRAATAVTGAIPKKTATNTRTAAAAALDELGGVAAILRYT